MDRQRIRFYSTLLVCYVFFDAIGELLGWALHRKPNLAAVTLMPVGLDGLLVWVRVTR